MILIFQSVDPVKIADRAFQIDPTNIYQFLVGLLFVAIIGLLFVIKALFGKIEQKEKRLEDLTVSITTVATNTQQVLESLVGSVDKLPAHIEKHKEEIIRATKDSEHGIQRAIDAIARK